MVAELCIIGDISLPLSPCFAVHFSLLYLTQALSERSRSGALQTYQSPVRHLYDIVKPQVLRSNYMGYTGRTAKEH
jgi:hypothetical protein